MVEVPRFTRVTNVNRVTEVTRDFEVTRDVEVTLDVEVTRDVEVTLDVEVNKVTTHICQKFTVVIRETEVIFVTESLESLTYVSRVIEFT